MHFPIPLCSIGKPLLRDNNIPLAESMFKFILIHFSNMHQSFMLLTYTENKEGTLDLNRKKYLLVEQYVIVCRTFSEIRKDVV